jgi:hypothetical protein
MAARIRKAATADAATYFKPGARAKIPVYRKDQSA